MKVIAKSNNLKPQELYQMANGNDIKRMRDVAGQTLELAGWLIFEDEKPDGEVATIVTIRTTEGEMYATNSPTFRRSFESMTAFFDSVDAIKVVSSTSKKGRFPSPLFLVLFRENRRQPSCFLRLATLGIWIFRPSTTIRPWAFWAGT